MSARLPILLILLAPSLVDAQSRVIPKSGYGDWSVYLGGPEALHYSTLRQIHPGNVHKLQVAWTYETGDASPGSEMQCNPIIVDGVLYATTPKLRVIALDAATGRELWSFDPNLDDQRQRRYRHRGVTVYKDRVFFTHR